MPLYEYECKKCHHRFERIQKFSDPHVKKCPKCGGPIEQVISAPAVQFKGSGWYVSDYARKGGAAEKSSGGEKSSGSAESGGAKEGAAASGGSAEKSSGSNSGTSAGDSAKPSGNSEKSSGGEKSGEKK